MKHKSSSFRKAFKEAATATAVAGMLFGIPLGIAAGVHYGTQEQMRVTIHDTHSSLLQKGEGFGFTKTVYETDKGELTNTWSAFAGKFSRAGMDEYLKTGKTYDVTVTGISVPFLGWYPNIIKAAEVPPPPGT